MAMESSYIWMDGQLVPYEKATLHFLTPALHYGAAVFEGIRCYSTSKGPAIFRAREHAERLLTSAEIFGCLNLPWSVDELIEAFKATVKANGFKACYIRPLIYEAQGGWNLSVDGTKFSLGVAAWEWDYFTGNNTAETGLRANVSSFTRHHPNATMTKAKVAGNYPNSILAKTESLRLGFDEAIMLDPQGYVSECTGENLFIVKKGTLRATPDVAVLEGITRASLITLAKDAGIKFEESLISRDQLYSADEVFACGTAAEVVPFREIDHRIIGEGKAGPITRALQKAFHETACGQGPRSSEWLTPVA